MSYETMIEEKKDDLQRTVELFEFLQGVIPEGYEISRKNRPNLTPDQASTVIWYLGNQYWQVTDHIQPCDVCGNLYDSDSEGDCLDYGRGRYHFCEQCMDSEGYIRKAQRREKCEKMKPTEAK